MDVCVLGSKLEKPEKKNQPDVINKKERSFRSKKEKRNTEGKARRCLKCARAQFMNDK
jgi:hypothetical protein